MTVSSWLQLANKTAVVTGAASGIGAAVVKALASEQCNVVLADRDHHRLQDVAHACEAIVQALFQNLSTASPATILINCAGITRDVWIGRMTVDQWQQVQDVNLKGTFLCCREFLAQSEFKMPNNTSLDVASSPLGGAIVNVSSVVATQGNLGQVNYAASKGGVWSLTKALAREVAPRKIRVNCVLPGFIDTEMTQAVPVTVREHIQQKIVFQQQFGKPSDIANLILFLASCHRSGYITGEAIECSGMISL
jgi:NAD(P)-dependent dehydrogenase (short-subunit alcohol dehydrogenase family)